MSLIFEKERLKRAECREQLNNKLFLSANTALRKGSELNSQRAPKYSRYTSRYRRDGSLRDEVQRFGLM